MKSYIYFAVFISSMLIACSTKNDDKKIEKAAINANVTTVKTVSISQSGNDTEMITPLGIVMSKGEAKPAFKTGGIIAKTFVAEGNSVRKGQLIATLMMDEINAQVRQAEEGLSKAERDMTRAKNLYQDSVATLEQFQNATTGYEFAKRTVDMAKFNKQYSEVRSPIDGKVIKQIMRSGEVVGPGMPIFAIMGTNRQDWVVKAGLVDRDWARVTKGEKVKISLDAYPGQKYTGTVTDKGIMSANASGTFDIEIKFDHQPQNLAAGLITKLEMSSSTKSTFPTVPIESLVKSDGHSAEAFTIVDGKAKTVKLTIAKIMGDQVAISGGLDGISELITTGALFLEEGDQVKKY